MKNGRISAIENSGPNTLVSFLRTAGYSAVEIDIGVAFVTQAGLESILHVLQRTAARHSVRLLTGLYQRFTEPKALRTLFRAQQDTLGRLVVHISQNPHFHCKIYCVKGKGRSDLVIGSSHLTLDGLSRTGEFNAVVSLPHELARFRQLHGPFERHWISKSQPLTEAIVQTYQAWRASVSVPLNRPSVPITKILGARKTTKIEQVRESSYWRTCIDGRLSEETESMLEETTDWDRHGYLYFSTWKPTYSVGDQMILFDLHEKSIYAAEIRETTQTPESTPDGRHFAAYRRIRNTYRRLVPKHWTMLKSSRLIRTKGDAHLSRRLTQARFRNFVDSLRLPTR